MEKVSTYSRSFWSHGLSGTKCREIRDFAVFLRDVRNEISTMVNKDLLKYLDMSKFDFQKSLLPEVNSRIPSNFNKKLLEDVHVAYQNKFDGIRKKLKFRHLYEYGFTFYKRSTKDHKPGDLKGLSRKYKETNLTRTLTYLARYGSPDICNYLTDKSLTEKDPSKKSFYDMVLDHVSKYGFDRLLRLALSKRKRIIRQYAEHPIEFKSLSFRGRSRLKSDIVSYNSNYNSVINAFINVSWGISNRKKLTIPVKYSKRYHHGMKSYTNGTDTSYVICFGDSHDEIRVILTCDEDRHYPDAGTGYIGMDVNIKHNLIQCSNGDSIDFDRNLVSELSREMIKTDHLKSIHEDYDPGKRRSCKIGHLERELKSRIHEGMAGLCKRLNKEGFDHAVFENLTGFEERCFCHDENDLNYNRRVRILHLSSIKDEFEHISRKYGIAVSLVHPCYTSQTCPVCGCVDGDNRKTQEEFECVECSHKDNADLNASINIRQRVASTVLRSELLKKSKLGNGTFEPKALSRDRVKGVLESLRHQQETGVSCQGNTADDRFA